MKTKVERTLIEGTVKLSVSLPDGELVVSPPGGGATYKGKLSDSEISQLAFRVFQASKGKIRFEPEGQDLIANAVKDITTLASQSEVIADMKARLAKSKARRLNLRARLEISEKALAAARNELKNSQITNEGKDDKAAKAEVAGTVEPVSKKVEIEPPVKPEEIKTDTKRKDDPGAAEAIAEVEAEIVARRAAAAARNAEIDAKEPPQPTA